MISIDEDERVRASSHEHLETLLSQVNPTHVHNRPSRAMLDLGRMLKGFIDTGRICCQALSTASDSRSRWGRVCSETPFP